jgi:YebC/PmpR family DNA-binding regulatory protein
MAGHSKWANIKHRKGAQDKKRAKQFTRAIKEITVAVKEGGGPDPEANSALRNAIQNAKGVNMPKDTIERAIKKASGADADNYEMVTFEGYGPNGIAIFVETTTDNTNRTVASVRSIFSKNGGSLGTNGSLEFLFDKKGVFILEKENIEPEIEELELELIEGGAQSFDKEDDYLTVYTDFNDFGMMSSKLEELKIEPKNSEVQRIPLNAT